MPATTKKQQRFFQLIHAIQAGKAEGSEKAMELAKTMDPETVKHYMKLDKAASVNDNKLLQYAAISALIGAGGAGLYGAGRFLHDKLLGPGKIEDMENEINTVLQITPEEAVKAEEVVAPSAVPALEDIASDNLLEAKLATVKTANPFGHLLEPKHYTDALYYGVATPLAMLVPAMLSFHFGKKLMDRIRNNSLSGQVEAAKNEFEEVLNQKQSNLKDQIDSLYLMTKEAVRPQREDIKIGPITLPGYTTDADGAQSFEVKHGPGVGPLGLTFLAGTLTALSGLAGYTLMRNQLKDNPEAKKVKALKSLLKKELASNVLETGLIVDETSDGQKRIEL